MKYNDLTFGLTEAIMNKLGGIERAKKLLNGEIRLVEFTPFENPEKIIAWRHDSQDTYLEKDRTKFRQMLQESGLLNVCLGIEDLNRLKNLGLDFFNEKFGRGVTAYGWYTMNYSTAFGCNQVPALLEENGELIIKWICADVNFRDSKSSVSLMLRK